jgi:hypothetical protein
MGLLKLKQKNFIKNKFPLITPKDGPHQDRLFFISLSKTNLMYKILAQINKVILPSFTKQRLDLAKAKKWQMAIIGFRYYVTTRALD